MRLIILINICDMCVCLFAQVDAKSYMPLFDCESKQCKTNQITGHLQMQTRGSKFVKYQELKLQELVSTHVFNISVMYDV